MIFAAIYDFFILTDVSTKIVSHVRRDAGYAAGSWLAGTNTLFRSVSVQDIVKTPLVTGAAAIYNLNVVRYQPGQKEIFSDNSFPFLPIAAGTNYKGAGPSNTDLGPFLNVPFVSAHVRGFSSAWLDGSTHFLLYDINLQTLFKIATRHDGIPITTDF